jgi:type II secretory pathway pseudopilin PulG
MLKKSLVTAFIFSLMMTNAFSQVAETAASGSGAMDSFKKYFDSPMGVAIIAGIATVYSTVLYKAAAKQEEESKENIKKIDKMIASFKDSYANYCPKGREDLNTPSCYCYLNNGSKNTNRSNSKICTDLWAKDSYVLSGDATNYNLGTYNPDVAGCVTVTGQFDELCKCKKLIDSAGNNACKKGTSVTLPAGDFSTGFATSTGLDSVLKYASNATNGNPRLDLLSTTSLNANAVKAKNIKDQLATKLPPGTKLPVIDESNVNKFATAVLGTKAVEAAMASSGSGSAMNIGAARSNNAATESLLKQAQAKVGLDIAGSGKGLGAVKAQKKNGMDFNFSDSGSPSGVAVMQDFPEEKNYKYKNSDIRTDNSTSIFEIISNRYIQSGLKRLFDDEVK